MSRYDFLNQYSQDGRHYSIDDMVSEAASKSNTNDAIHIMNAFSHKLTSDHIDRLYHMPPPKSSIIGFDTNRLKSRLILHPDAPNHIVDTHFHELGPHEQAQIAHTRILSPVNVESSVSDYIESTHPSYASKTLAKSLMQTQAVEPHHIDALLRHVDPSYMATNDRLPKESIVHLWNLHKDHPIVSKHLPLVTEYNATLSDSDRRELRTMFERN